MFRGECDEGAWLQTRMTAAGRGYGGGYFNSGYGSDDCYIASSPRYNRRGDIVGCHNVHARG